MASEISNTANQGMLQGKHYLNAWASLPLAGESTLQPSPAVIALMAARWWACIIPRCSALSVTSLKPMPVAIARWEVGILNFRFLATR